MHDDSPLTVFARHTLLRTSQAALEDDLPPAVSQCAGVGEVRGTERERENHRTIRQQPNSFHFPARGSSHNVNICQKSVQCNVFHICGDL